MAGSDESASLQACAMRISRLAADGTTPAGATNLIVTAGLIKLDAKAIFDAGEDITQKNACGSIALAYKSPELFKRYDLAITYTNPNAEIAEMMTGGTIITSGGMTIGYSVPAVGTAPSNGVCLEVWSKAWLGGSAPANFSVTDGVLNATSTVTSATANFVAGDVGASISGGTIPAGATITAVGSSTSATISVAATGSATGVTLLIGRPGAYWRHVFPRVQGSVGDFSLEGAVRATVYNGPAQENQSIGNGPANDFPSTMASTRAYSYFRDHALPALGTVGYQSQIAQV